MPVRPEEAERHGILRGIAEEVDDGDENEEDEAVLLLPEEPIA